MVMGFLKNSNSYRVTKNDQKRAFVRRMSNFGRASFDFGESTRTVISTITSSGSLNGSDAGAEVSNKKRAKRRSSLGSLLPFHKDRKKDSSCSPSLWNKDDNPNVETCIPSRPAVASTSSDSAKFRGFTGLRSFCNMPLDGDEDSTWSALRKELQNMSLKCMKEQAEIKEGRDGETALHLVCRQNPPSDIIDKLLWASSEVAEWPTNRSQWLPLHILCYRGASEATIRRVVQAFPDARLAVDANGQTPLHLYIRYEAEKLTFSKIRLLSAPQVVNMRDKWKKLPISMKCICDLAEKIQPEAENERNDALKCIDTFLDGKLDYLRRPSSRSTSKFILHLEDSPEWFKCHVMVHPYVKALLNWRITRNFPTCVLMLDFFVLILLILCFRSASLTALDTPPFQCEDDNHSNGGWCIAMLYLGVAYLFFREVMQIASLAVTGNFSTWIFDVWNWLDCLCIATVFNTTLHMHFGTDDHEHLSYLIILTTAVLWLMMLSFLKLTRHNFAVFVTGVIHVPYTVSSFIFMLGLILLAFAQMFATKYQGSEYCMESMNRIHDSYSFNETLEVPAQSEIIENNFCTKHGSYLKVYTLLIGGTVDDAVSDINFVHDRVGLWLYISFSFLVVLLLNLLIAVITDSYSEVKSHGDTVFWSHRLSFVYEVNNIGDLLWRNDENEEQIGDTSLSILSVLWDIAMIAFENPANMTVWKKKCSLNDEWNGPKWLIGDIRNPAQVRNPTAYSYESLADMARKLFFLIFVPVWISSGFLSAGLLWPPQVRCWLICPDLVETHEITNTLQSEDICKVQKEIHNEIVKVEATIGNSMEGLGTRMLDIDHEISHIKGDVNAMMESIDGIYMGRNELKDNLNDIKNALSNLQKKK